MLGQSPHNGRWCIIGIYMHTPDIMDSHYQTPVNKDILNSTSGVIVIIRHNFITLISKSLEKGVFTDKWKTAIIKPVLKKVSLEFICKTYRPVSNLSFLS